MEKISVDIPAEGGLADAYLVVPDGDGPFRTVLLYMDAFGLRPRLREMADRIAAQGYAVLVPNLFYRAGPAPLVDMSDLATPEGRERTIGTVTPLVQGLTTELLLRDTAAHLDFLESEKRVAKAPVAITGYCMGGRNAFKAIAAFPDRIKGVASFHGGGLVTGQPDSPHLAAHKVTGELYFGHADNDRSMTAEQIAELERTLDAAGVRYTSELYEGAAHGYTMSDTASYNEAAEQRHWEVLIPFLEKVLKSDQVRPAPADG
ncbi:dienelactone hydrolase family protein [Actinoplanes sp. RD1]|uniref:dienelactone hydrolase family protein n=1 Tax=Actinoplanes sp. RD1 TaxID=3064538 RepID=UPI00274141B2|nr:dienelactone hydrolase family protein [Actinoplanes sp. RD1]